MYIVTVVLDLCLFKIVWLHRKCFNGDASNHKMKTVIMLFFWGKEFWHNVCGCC